MDDKLVQATLSADIILINELLRQSPEADKGCQSEHVYLLALASSIPGHKNLETIASEIRNSCSLPERILQQMDALSRLEPDNVLVDIIMDWIYVPSFIDNILASYGDLTSLIILSIKNNLVGPFEFLVSYEDSYDKGKVSREVMKSKNCDIIRASPKT